MSKIVVEKVAKSKIDEVDFSCLEFGQVFSDHMFVCTYKDGEWQNPKIMPYSPFCLDPASSVFHYGQAVFEGMKAYKDDKGAIFLFRPEQNYQRMAKSCQRLSMAQFPTDLFDQGLKELVKTDRQWIKPGRGNALYLRPFMISTSKNLQVETSQEYLFSIIASPVQSYYSADVKVLIADHYSRAANGGFGFAKAAGNYAGQLYPTTLAQQKGYNQIIWTDDTSHERLEECGTMNVMFRIKDKLITSPTSERILDGVTRKSIIEVAKKLNIEMEIRPITIHELVEAANNKTLKEIFGCGTAAVISPVSAFNYKGVEYEVSTPEQTYGQKIKDFILDIQYNICQDPFGWRVEVK